MSTPDPTNIALGGKESTQYKMLDAAEKQQYIDEWDSNKQKIQQEIPEMEKYNLLGDPKIVSYICAAAIAYPDLAKRPLYEQKLVDYINTVEAASNFDTLNWNI